jgi:hypothetical protein
MKPELTLIVNPEFCEANPESVRALKDQIFRTRRYLEMKRRSPEVNAELLRQDLASRFG